MFTDQAFLREGELTTPILPGYTQKQLLAAEQHLQNPKLHRLEFKLVNSHPASRRGEHLFNSCTLEPGRAL